MMTIARKPLRVATVGVVLTMTFASSAGAVECPMSRATYTELRSGAVIQFRPVPEGENPATANIFDLTFPNSKLVLPGDVTWSGGRRSLPFTTVRRECSAEGDEPDFTGLCELWSGFSYSLLDGNAKYIDFEEDAAPKGIMLADFGDSLSTWSKFYEVNPEGYAWDVFQLTGCAGGDK